MCETWLDFLVTQLFKPRINVKKPYRRKWRAKRAIKPAAGGKFLTFASRFSDFRASFNPIQTAFRRESIKILEFNAAIYVDRYADKNFIKFWRSCIALYYIRESYEKLYYVH